MDKVEPLNSIVVTISAFDIYVGSLQRPADIFSNWHIDSTEAFHRWCIEMVPKQIIDAVIVSLSDRCIGSIQNQRPADVFSNLFITHK